MKKFFALLSVLVSVFMLLTGCSAQDLQTAIDIADTVYQMSEALGGEEVAATTAAVQATPAPTAKATPAPTAIPTETPAPTQEALLDEDGTYTTAEDVALYIHTYGKLPGNFVTKNTARDAGWEGGGLEDYLPGKCIGGDRFGNYEGLLPEGKYTECDINTLGKNSRGAERIVFSDDGNIYYTPDHYETFELLYEP